MGIIFDDKNKIFHLKANNTSYVIKISKYGHLVHGYWGKQIRETTLKSLPAMVGRSFSPNPSNGEWEYSLDTIPQEYPSYGSTDLREPAYQIQLEDGSTITDLRYQSHKIIKGKPQLEGLPSTYVEEDAEAQTLQIILLDELAKLEVVLSYTVYEKYDAVTRTAHLLNKGTKNLKILRALSMSVDFDNCNYDMLQLSGAWARERHLYRRPLTPGVQAIDSRRAASSHQQNPFIALVSKNADEDFGEAFGFSLVYSGNFLARAEVDQFNTTRVSMGINPFDFSWLLTPGESFQTPEVVMVYSCNGIGEMSRTYHKLYRTRLCRGKYRDEARPILVNNWEATYFNFNADKIEAIAKSGKELGIELFVLDDGWFGKRDSDNSSLGDWVVDKNKLPQGLPDLVERVNKLGMKFGLWFEPEMVSPNSDLYRVHPDWCIHVPGRDRSEGRNQLILDLTKKEVCDYIIEAVSKVLHSAPISYVKWDMNRHMSEIGSSYLPSERQRETAHRYMLGLYRVMGEITAAFPNVLFESCSGGGGRFDPGILYFMPQTWTSDDTDAVERLKIQYGTSMVYPSSTMGAHVSAVPNHQLGRSTSLKMRGDVAMSGNFGYELDLTKFSQEEKEIVKKQITEYKMLRSLIQFGDFYRLLNPFEGNEAAWMYVSEDKKEAFAAYFRVMAIPNGPLTKLKLKGLHPQKNYKLVGSNKIFGGDELMYIGLDTSSVYGDFQSIVFKFEEVE